MQRCIVQAETDAFPAGCHHSPRRVTAKQYVGSENEFGVRAGRQLVRPNQDTEIDRARGDQINGTIDQRMDPGVAERSRSADVRTGIRHARKTRIREIVHNAQNERISVHIVIRPSPQSGPTGEICERFADEEFGTGRTGH
jgi:hypothetical protein